MTFDFGNPVITLFVTVGILIGLKYAFKYYYKNQTQRKNEQIENHRLNLSEKTLPKGFEKQYYKPDDKLGEQ